METQKYYLRNKILTYRDIATNVYLDVSLDLSAEGNGKWTGTNAPSICFSVIDSRRSGKDTILGICLRYDKIVELIDHVTKLFANGPEAAFKSGGNIHIAQYYNKKRKEILFSFAYDQQSQPVIQLTITDTCSTVGKTSININNYAFNAIGRILKDFANNPISISLQARKLISDDRLINHLKDFNNKMQKGMYQLHTDINNQIVNPIEPDEYANDEPTPETNLQKEFQKKYEETNGFSGVNPRLEGFIKETKVLGKTKVDQPLISNFLDYDLGKLTTWVSSFICTTEKSSPTLFTPFDFIFNMASISKEEKALYDNDYGYNSMQYALVYLLKSNVKKAIETGQYPDDIPAIRFHEMFKKGTKCYDLSKEVITIFLIYSLVVGQLTSWDMANQHMSKIEDYLRTFFALKLLFSPFIFSMGIGQDLKDELCVEFDKCKVGGLLQSVEEFYNAATCGGKLVIDRSTFEKGCKTFIDVLKQKKSQEFDTKEKTGNIFRDYHVFVHIEELTNGENIKKAIFEIPKIKKEKTIVVVPTEKELNMLDGSTTEEDDKLILFIDSSKGIIDNDIIEDIKGTCNKYNDLVNYLRDNDVPSEIFKIKRVLDINPELKNRIQVLKNAKLLKEDDSVTETRVIQGEIESKSNKVDIQSLLSTDGIF